jgi:uncharacterized protein DUF5666
MTARLRRFLPAVFICVLAAACGGSTPKSPTAPGTAGTEATGTPSPSPTTGATISGLVSSGASTNMAAAIALGASGLAGVTITVSGTGLHATSDGAGHFTLTGVPSGNVRLQFSGGANGDIEIDDVDAHERITLVVHGSGSGMEIDVEEREGGPEAQLEGKIASVNTGAHTFVISDISVSVPGSASIAHGSRTMTFSDLVVGARVHVKGSKTGSTITATRIEVQQSGGPGPGNGNGNGGNGNGTDDNDNDDNDDNPGGAQEVEFTGTVSSLSGTCPALTFAAAGRSVTTTSSTNFRTECSAIHNGLNVEVKGTATGNGPVTATRIKAED